jgi:hypothetical protein
VNDSHSAPLPHPAVFHQVFILKVVKVVCFDTLLQVLILKGFALHQNCVKCEERGLLPTQRPVQTKKAANGPRNDKLPHSYLTNTVPQKV